ncbi:MAG: HEAT repeat domain-containing protein [Desulfobacterales bacterium]|nr:HEAT repeat domain-containing protein [Desulfobacterales bacterium]
MKRPPAFAAIFAIGLFAAQAVFTFFVYQSNTALLNRLEAIAGAGYLVVPNTRIMASLDAFLPAFCGGLFFTLTAGAGLVLGSFILIYLWRFVLAGRPEIFLIMVILWEIGIYKAARTGAPILLTTAFTGLPLLILALMVKWTKASERVAGWRLALPHLLAILVIAGIWMPNLNAEVFINIRDQILLSNPVGQKINSFYYRYTLYPAEAFKSLSQKQINPAHIQISEPGLFAEIETALRSKDYLRIPPDFPADLTVRKANEGLLFAHKAQNILEISVSRFLRSPRETLRNFSQKTDQMQFLRQFTFFSLIIASPLLLYFFVYALVFGLFFWIRRPLRRQAFAAFACVFFAAAGAFALYPVQANTRPDPNPAGLASKLKSDSREQRIQALKIIDDKDVPISDYETALIRLAKSSAVAERYWAVKAMDNSDSTETYQILLKRLHDPHPNVACMALYSLGQRNAERAISEIKHVLRNSDHWYVQWYAYNALKELGWVQPESI